MTRDEAMDMLNEMSERAERVSAIYDRVRFVLLINPDTGYSVPVPKNSIAGQLIAAGWEPVAEFENGKQVEVHRFHLHLK